MTMKNKGNGCRSVKIKKANSLPMISKDAIRWKSKSYSLHRIDKPAIYELYGDELYDELIISFYESSIPFRRPDYCPSEMAFSRGKPAFFRWMHGYFEDYRD